MSAQTDMKVISVLLDEAMEQGLEIEVIYSALKTMREDDAITPAQAFQEAMNEGKNVLICIRDIEPDEKNPFSAEDVRKNILDHYSEEVIQGKVKVMVIPDICSIEFGRGVGYEIIERIPPVEIGEISATKIREEMRKEGKL